MSIDWVTFTAQIVNFLILVWLLRRFLYGPILKAMNEREQKIITRLENAQEREEAAKNEEETYRQNRAEFEKERDALLAEARKEAEETKSRLIDQAREEVEQDKISWQEALQQKKAVFLEDIRRHSAQFAYEAARKLLTDLADADLQKKIVEHFLRQLMELSRDEKDTIVRLLRGSGENIQVTTAFDLPAGLREEITRTIHHTISPDAGVRFETNSSLVAGIELKARGYKLPWSIDSYLKNLVDSLSEEIDRKTKTETTRTG